MRQIYPVEALRHDSPWIPECEGLAIGHLEFGVTPVTVAE